MKRDDLYKIADVNGVKARAVMRIAKVNSDKDIQPYGWVTSGSRQGTTGPVVAAIAGYHGVPFRYYCPRGPATSETDYIKEHGGEIIECWPGYGTVVRARAREWADRTGALLFPYGLECAELRDSVAEQVANVPTAGVQRIVTAVGGGMALSGILTGLADRGLSVPVLGVRVGSTQTEKRLDRWGPADWRDRVTFVDHPASFTDRLDGVTLDGIPLDPMYEAKAYVYLAPGDLFWITGHRPV